MKPLVFFLTAIASFACSARGADQPGAAPAPAAALSKAVFLVSGLECGSCAYMVQYTLAKTPGISEVEVLQSLDHFARVSFDPKVISEHQIAQAVRDAPGLHGTPYLASIKLHVPGYAEKGNAAKVKAIFERWKQWVELEVWDEREGELHVHFKELAKDAKGIMPRGLSLAQLTAALQSPAPKGPGLKCEIPEPEQF